MCYPDSSHGVHSRNPHAPAIEQSVSIHIFQLVDLSLKYLSRRRFAMWPTNWLHRLCCRAPSFPRVQHCIKTGKAGLERLHSQAHCGDGNQEIFGDSVSRLRRSSAVSAISRKRWSWTGLGVALCLPHCFGPSPERAAERCHVYYVA